MRIANYRDRAHLIFLGTDTPTGTNTSSSSERYDGGSVTGIDIGTASGGTFGTDVAELYPRWAEFTEWARTAELGDAEHVEINQELLGAPSPAPTQILAVGLNYAEHADESGFDKPVDLPPVFTKFRSALTGPRTAVVLPQVGTRIGRWNSRWCSAPNSRAQRRTRRARPLPDTPGPKISPSGSHSCAGPHRNSA